MVGQAVPPAGQILSQHGEGGGLDPDLDRDIVTSREAFSMIVRQLIPLAAAVWMAILPSPAQAQFTQQGPKLVGTGAVLFDGMQGATQGSSVAISADGSTALVGGPLDGPTEQGAVWVFTRTNGFWSQQGAKLFDVISPYDQGFSVSLSGDGNTAIEGLPLDGLAPPGGLYGPTGAARIFTRNAGVWSEAAYLVGTGVLGEGFQGSSVALSSDGATALVGGSHDDGEIGAAWVFTRNGASWSQQAKLVGTGGVSGGSFPSLLGFSAALSRDGNTAIFGGFGAAWVFTRNGTLWSQQSKLAATASRGGTCSVAISADGNTAILGGQLDSNTTGLASVYVRNSSGVWNLQANLVWTSVQKLLNHVVPVALSADGNTAILGSPEYAPDGIVHTGAAWVFRRGGDGTWSQPGVKLLGTGAVDAGYGAQQGASVALSADGSTALLGGPYDNNQAGATWVFAQPHFTVSAPATASAGAPFHFTASALDANNAALASYSGTVHFSSSDPAAVLPADAMLSAGAGSFSATLKSAGGQTLIAADAGNSAVTGVSNSIAVTVPPATHFSVAAPASAVAGVAFNFMVTALDASNNTAAGYTGTVHFTSSDSAATLPPNASLTNGVGTFSATLKTAGSQTIAASDAAITGTSNAILVVPAGGVPAPVGVSPAAGSAASSQMTFTFTDSGGYQALGVLNILINRFLDGRSACYLAYSQPSNALYLVGDDGGTLLGGSALTSAGSVSNSQCAVSWGSSPVAASGNNATLTLTIAFTAGFGGNKVIYMAARDQAAGNSGWQPLGVAGVPGGSQTTTTAVMSMSPASGAGFGPVPFTLSFSDTKGFQDLGVLNILVNNSIDGRHACYLAYSRPANTLYLVDDSGDGGGPFAGSALLTAAGSIQNSQCMVSWGATPVATSGNGLALALNIGFTAAFGGNQIFYLAARDVNDLNNTDWQAMGARAVR